MSEPTVAAIDLTAADRRIILGLLREHLPGVTAWVYGSRASGTARPTSDLDLVVFAGPDHEPQVGELREAFEESNLPFRVDLFVWDSLPDTFRDHIERGHIPLTGHSRAETRDSHARPDGWKNVTLGKITDLRLSSVDKKRRPQESDVLLCNYMDVYKNEFIRDGMDFSSATATTSEIAKCSLSEGDVLITKDSEKHDDIGVPALVRSAPRGLLCGYHLAILRPLESDVEGAYLFYALRTHEAQNQFHSYANGVTRFGLRKADISRVVIRLPPRAEQREIARVLTALDDKIELNRRLNQTLEAMARPLFKDWFVDFGPVRAKMEGRPPYLPPDVWTLFPDRLVDSELGKIPEGWQVGTLGDIAAAPRSGIDPGRVADDTPYIGLEHMPRRSVALTDWGRAGSVSSIKTAFENRDVLFGKLRPYFHKVGIAPVNGVCSTDIVVLKARMPEWSAFVLACVSSSGFVGYASQTSTGTKMPRTSWRTMSRYEMCRPSVAVAAAFQHVVSPMFERIVANVHESRTLGRLRDALLPKLVSGELRAPLRRVDAEMS